MACTLCILTLVPLGRYGKIAMFQGESGAAAEGKVPGYRCYFMSGEHIQAVQNFECTDDAEVILKSSTLLDSHPEHRAVEIWEGKRLVAHIGKTRLADTNAQHEGNVYALCSKPER
jgi:hypothetical protein